MCHAVSLMETSLADRTGSPDHQPQQRIVPSVLNLGSPTANAPSSPVSLVVAVASAGRRAFSPQRVINDFTGHDDILRFAQPSNAFIKTYGSIITTH